MKFPAKIVTRVIQVSQNNIYCNEHKYNTKEFTALNTHDIETVSTTLTPKLKEKNYNNLKTY